MMVNPHEIMVMRYQIMPEDALAISIIQIEVELAELQSRLAAARKAQKNQKRAAKERKKVVG